jgi:hypothetical protein
MSEWYKVTLTQQEIASFRHVAMQNSFQGIFMSKGGLPEDAAMFTYTETRFPTDYFFSPSAVSIARPLILHYSGEPCAVPNGDELSLVVGTAQSIELIFGKKP